MDLRQLQHLLAVADHRSFSGAARALHTVQSNVSSHIARLERELEVTLVDRRTMNLTAEGSAVVDRARRIQLELQAISDDIVAMRDEVRGLVRVGVIGTTGRWLAPELLAAVHERLPKVSIVLVDATTTSLLPQVVAGTLDLAIVNTPMSDADVELRMLFEEELILVAPTDHPLAAMAEVDIPTATRYPLLLPPPGTVYRQAIDADAARHGVVFRVLAEVDGMRLLATLAMQAFGPALLPASAIPAALASDVWRRIRVPELSRRGVGVIRSRRTSLSAPVRAVLDVLVAVIAGAGPRQPGIHVTP